MVRTLVPKRNHRTNHFRVSIKKKMKAKTSTITILILLVVLLIGLTLKNFEPDKKSGAESTSPHKGFDLHVDAKHYVKDTRVAVHHWCKTIHEKLIECTLFDSDDKNAHLIGIETIVTNDIWNTFTEQQKKEWHDHAVEIFEAEATLPDTPKTEADQIVEFLKGTHGRVTYIWNFPDDEWPVTRPFLDSDSKK